MKYLFIAIALLFLASCQQNTIPANSPKIAYQGRIKQIGEAGAEMYWSGSQLKVNFSGGTLGAVLNDEKGESMYNVLLDDGLVKVLTLQKGTHTYNLVSDIPAGKHTLTLFRRNEYERGKATFVKLIKSKSTKILPKSEEPTRKIEFFGNSITAGYAIEDSLDKDRWQGYFTNHYLTYANLTAQHFAAAHHCTCKSGIGITISWFPEIMPDVYDRLNPLDSSSQWNFAQFVPDVVVVNLFQNDSWLVNKPDYPTFKQRFPNGKPNDAFIIQAYQDFIAQLRSKYPQAHIICMLGSMDIVKDENSKWKDYVNQAVSKLNDAKIHTLFFPFCGHNTHPNVADNRKMAEMLIKFIAEKVGWK